MHGLIFLVSVSAIAMASKFLIAYRGKHLFNPAAFGVLITFYALGQGAAWWVGNSYLLIPVVLGGLLVVRKIQRFDLVLSFFAVELATLAINSNDPQSAIKTTLINSSLLFFAFVMLVEPTTTPPTRRLRILYGAGMGFLYATSFSIGQIFSSPELVLVLGNIFVFAVSPKGRYKLTLKSQMPLANGVYQFAFDSNRKLEHKPGQYLDWTVDPSKTDLRGNRRYFTIASSPTEDDVKVGVKFYDLPSTFKKKLRDLVPGDKIFAGQLTGEFTLPADTGKKLVFIAGGIGITPFRSMIKYLIDKNEKRDIVLFYSNKNESEVAYKDILDEAASKLGIKTVYVYTDSGGYLNAEMIKHEISDLSQRTFMISGPRSMVVVFEDLLKSLQIPGRQIKVDFFPGYV